MVTVVKRLSASTNGLIFWVNVLSHTGLHVDVWKWLGGVQESVICIRMAVIAAIGLINL